MGFDYFHCTHGEIEAAFYRENDKPEWELTQGTVSILLPSEFATKNIIYELCEMMIAPRPPIKSRNSTCVVAPFIFHWPEVALSSSWKGEKSPLPLTISRATYWKQNVWELLLLALVRSECFLLPSSEPFPRGLPASLLRYLRADMGVPCFPKELPKTQKVILNQNIHPYSLK